MLIHQSQYKSEKTESVIEHIPVKCTVHRCLLQIRLLKVSLIPGFHTSVVSPEFICCYPTERTQNDKYIHLVCKLSCV